VLFANNIGSANGTVNPNMVGATLKVANNVFLGGNSSAGTSFNLIGGGSTRFISLTPVSGGTINMGSSLEINASTVGATNNLTVGDGSNRTVGAANNLTLGVANNIKSGGEMWTLGGRNTLAGTVVSDGVLRIGNPLPGSNNAGTGAVLSGTGTAPRVLTLTNDDATNLSINTGTLHVLDGPPTTPLSLVKNGAGTVVLNGANTYTGSVNVNAGTLLVQTWKALGSQATVVIGGVSGTGALVLPQDPTNPAPTTLVLNNPVTINGTSVAGGSYPVSNGLITVNGGSIRLSGAAITAATSTSTITGNLTLNGGATVVTNIGTTTPNLVTTGTILTLGSSHISLVGGNFTIGSAFSGTLHVLSTLSSATNLILQRNLSIGGTAVSSGSYPVTNGTISVNGEILQLSGATITVPTTP
jgi:autotransporter-associated beta strand protein